MIALGAITTVEIVSRSGRARATLHAGDLDEDERTPETIARIAASTAYSPLSEPDRHAELATACLDAVMRCEAMPGDAVGECALADGRRVVSTRRIG